MITRRFYILSCLLWLITGCGDSGDDTYKGSISTPDFTASPQEFTLTAGGKLDTVRFALAVSLVSEKDTTRTAIHVDSGVGFQIKYLSSFSSDPGCPSNNCKLLLFRGDWSDFAISAPASLAPGTYQIKSWIETDAEVMLTIHVIAPNSGPLIFSDSLFPASDWTSPAALDNTIGGATVSAKQVAGGGNPGAFRQTSIGWTGGSGQTVKIKNLLSGAIYDPSISGAITSVAYSWDQQATDTSGVKTASSVSLLLVQNGKSFISSPCYGNTVGWYHQKSTGDAAVLFNEVPAQAGSHPDFSATGGPIQFGYLITSPDHVTSKSNYCVVSVDNWSVTINK